MSKSSFANLIIGKLSGSIGTSGSSYSSGTPAIANNSICLGCQEYIIANTTISVLYTGVLPSGSPDIVPDSVKVTGVIPPCSGTDFSSWISSLESSIVSGILVGPGMAGVLPSAPFNAFVKGIISPHPLYGGIGDYNNNAQQTAWETICGVIMDWINGVLQVGRSYPAIHGPSVGTALIQKITIT